MPEMARPSFVYWKKLWEQRKPCFDCRMYEEKHHPNGFVFKPKLKPSAAGSIWRGGARKRADGDFLHKKSSEQSELCSDVVREAGVEPARPCEHWHLKPASLPIPPLAHLIQLAECSAQRKIYIITKVILCQHLFRKKLFFCRFMGKGKMR